MAELLQADRGPFRGGYTSSVPAFMARPDQLTGLPAGTNANLESSRDCVIDPLSGGVAKRQGVVIQNDTLSSGLEVTGLLLKKWGAKSRKVGGFDSPSMASGLAAPSILFGEDTNAGFPTADSGFPGTLYVKSHNTGLTDAEENYTLLREMNTSGAYAQTYNAAHDNTDFYCKVVPIWIESGDGVYNRGVHTGTSGSDKFMQQFITCGSRSLLQTQNWLYAPNLRCTPWRHNKRMNEQTVDENVRLYPTGPLPPLFPPRMYSTGLSSVSTGATWEDGDTLYVSVVFQFEDGSYSAPFIPRAVNATLASGLGLVTVGTIGGSNKYAFLPYRNIPIGPEGTVARILCRTKKQLRTASTDTVTVAPLDLRVFGVLRNNTQTSYNDYNGDDDSLQENNDVIRVDYTLPRRARYIGTGDQRALISYTLPNTAAIYLSIVNTLLPGNNNYNRNVVDTDSAYYGNAAALVRITSSQLEIHLNTGAGPDFTATTGNAIAFTFASYPTIGELVDAINTTVYGASGSGTLGIAGQWAAQLAPGIDETIASTSLTLTTMDIVTATNDSTTITSAGLFGPVGVGMKVSGTGVTAGTYVVSKESASSITVSTATSGGAAAPSLTFYQETGDNGIVTGGTVGYMRCFGPGFPLLLHVKPSALPGYDKPDKTSVYYTNASPGVVASGMSLAPNNWLAGNKNVPTASPRPQMQRVCQGIVDIEGAALVAYNDGIFVFANRRGANTGEDFDCRLFTVNNSRGCISHLGLISGDGWAAYATPEGIVCTDKNLKEFRLSGDVFNPSDNTGDLAYDIANSAASAAADTDEQWLSMAVMGSRIYVAYYNSGDEAHILSYDFSPGIEASGVEELLNPETKTPYIWNPPWLPNFQDNIGRIGAMGSVTGASGREDYITYCENHGGTGDGRLERINTGTQDNGANITAYGVPAPVIPSSFKALAPQHCEVIHKTLTSGQPAKLLFANDQVPTWNSTLQRTVAVSTTKTLFQKQQVPIDQQQRGTATEVFWIQWRTGTGSTTTDRLWSIALQYEETEVTNPVGSA